MGGILLSCSGKRSMDLPKVNFQDVKAEARKGILYVEDTIFSGAIYGLHPNGKDTAFIQNYLDGREHGVWKQFYPKGEPKEIRNFVYGKKEGEYQAWWMDGQKKLSYHFVDGEYQGICCEWNRKGVLIKKMTYQQGYEQGHQKIWHDNGSIKSNYVVKEGRRYGLLGTKNCINVSDSIFSN